MLPTKEGAWREGGSWGSFPGWWQLPGRRVTPQKGRLTKQQQDKIRVEKSFLSSQPCSHLPARCKPPPCRAPINSHHVHLQRTSTGRDASWGEAPSCLTGAFPMHHPALKPSRTDFYLHLTASWFNISRCAESHPQGKPKHPKQLHLHAATTIPRAFLHLCGSLVGLPPLPTHLLLTFRAMHPHGSSSGGGCPQHRSHRGPKPTWALGICTQKSLSLLPRRPPLDRKADGSNTH